LKDLLIMLRLKYAPDPIFSCKAKIVTTITAEVKDNLEQMLTIMYKHNGIGLGANMVGLLECLVVIDLQENGVRQPYKMINPKVVEFSENSIIMLEASLSFPGVKAKITRAADVTVSYFDEDNQEKNLQATGLLARVLQHEIDYLHGKVFLDYLSATKRKILLRKIKIK
jgi:peptide deformylase